MNMLCGEFEIALRKGKLCFELKKFRTVPVIFPFGQQPFCFIQATASIFLCRLDLK